MSEINVNEHSKEEGSACPCGTRFLSDIIDFLNEGGNAFLEQAQKLAPVISPDKGSDLGTYALNSIGTGLFAGSAMVLFDSADWLDNLSDIVRSNFDLPIKEVPPQA
jgi:hypothetical protein